MFQGKSVMKTGNAAALPEGALILVDSAPIIYVLEGNPKLAARFQPLFDLSRVTALKVIG